MQWTIINILSMIFVAFWLMSCSLLTNNKLPSQQCLPTKQISDLTDPILWSNVLQKAQMVFEGKQSDIAMEDKRFEMLVNLLATSKKVVINLRQKTHATVVFAVYKEANRMLPKALHKHGEDFICEKIRQMDWFSDCPNFSWDMVIIDDGCPEGSGKKAQKILDNYSKKTKKDGL